MKSIAAARGAWPLSGRNSSSREELRRDPENATAIRDYNFAIARIFQIIQDAKLNPWTKPLTVPGPREISFSHIDQIHVRSGTRLLYDFTPADEFDVGGKYVTERTTRAGIGAPIVAVEREPNKNAQRDFAPSRIFYSVTVVAHFEGRRCVLAFEDPLDGRDGDFLRSHCSAGGGFHRAARGHAPADRSEEARVGASVDPEKYAHTAAIERLQPYRPEQDRRPRHPWTDGFAGDLDADDQHAARRSGYPEALPVLVLQLPERLSVSVFRRDPARRTRSRGKAVSQAESRWW